MSSYPQTWAQDEMDLVNTAIKEDSFEPFFKLV